MKRYFRFFLVLSVLFLASSPFSLADEMGSEAVLRKLNEISQDQKQILQSLEDVKSELEIVKIRITSH